MYGIVSLLDDTHTGRIEQLWALFSERFGVHGAHKTPIPHISYHVAMGYDLPTLKTILSELARQVQPFTLRTNGLGLFTGTNPVLYIPVLEDAPIISLHRQIWQDAQITKIADAPRAYYQPGEWRPHITLTEGDIDHHNLPDVIRLLSQHDFLWHIPINNLAIIGGGNDDHDIHGLIQSYPLGG